MICAVQSLTLKSGEVGSAHRMAATEICAARNGLLIGITIVVACNVPVEPRSTLASPPPNTTAKPAFFRALSIAPCRLGVVPKSPVHSCVPLGADHDKAFIAIKLPLKAIPGSLLPKDSVKGVMTKLGSLWAHTTTTPIPTTVLTSSMTAISTFRIMYVSSVWPGEPPYIYLQRP